jgi:5-methylcytosine-specific restriction endonuclease McrA
MSLSIDHIIPRSQGGSHKIDNLRAAHLLCNSQRGAKPAA